MFPPSQGLVLDIDAISQICGSVSIACWIGESFSLAGWHYYVIRYPGLYIPNVHLRFESVSRFLAANN